MTEKKNLPTRTSLEVHPADCFVCGPENIHGMHTAIPFDESRGEVSFRHEFRGHELGAPGKSRMVHGGALAALMDEAQGCLAHHIGHLVMTEQLTLRYHKATEISQPVRIRAWATAVRRRRLYTRAVIENLQGDVLVSSSAKWYLLPDKFIERVFAKAGGVNKFDIALLEANRKRAKEIRKRLKQNQGVQNG